MTGLRIVAGNRLEDLARSFAETAGDEPLPPLCRETIVVQSPAMERWFSIRMASLLGVWADYHFPYPNQAVHSILRAFFPSMSADRIFDRDLMAWRLVDLIPSRMNNDGSDVIRRYVEANGGGAALYHLAREIADLFDQYLTFRPDMINRWDRGQEEDGESWQAALWRDLAPFLPGTHPPALRQEFLSMIRQRKSGDVPGLPARLTVFGVSYLPPFHAEILMEVARVIPVTFYMLAPTPNYWGDILTRREAGRIIRRAGTAVDPGTLHLEGDNSLLASLGRPGRDFQKLLLDRDHYIDPCFTEPAGDTLLAYIQRSIFTMDMEGLEPVKPDESLRMVSCHGPLREVEVLHDYIQDILQSDKTLQPRDILVMTPDIETYAPYISAVFAPGTQGGIPCDVVDRLAARESSLLRALFMFLDLPDRRLTGPEIMDILSGDAISAALGLDRSDLDLIRTWIDGSGIRWGLDGPFRGELGLPSFHGNTWAHGLDRLVTGYVMDDDVMYNGIVPVDGIGTGQGRVLGILHMFIERLSGFIGRCRQERTPSGWADFLEEFFSPFADADDLGEYATMRDALTLLRRAEEGAPWKHAVPYETVRAYLRGLSSSTRSKRPLVSGRVTFSQMLPLRSIPFRVICLLGMNDGVFPRAARSAGFNLMGLRPMAGDRSLRDEDRYLFLEVLLSARDRLYISYTGQSIDDNSMIPPSVLVSELADYIADRTGAGTGPVPGGGIVVRHPLQTFSRRYFDGTGLWTYSAGDYRALLSAGGDRRDVPPFIQSPLEDVVAEKIISVGDLVSFVTHPSRYFLTSRLGIRFPRARMALDDAEPFSIDGLDLYAMGQELTAVLLDDPDGAGPYMERVRAEGRLPHGSIGRCGFDDLAREVKTFADNIRPRLEGVVMDPVAGGISAGDISIRVILNGLRPGGITEFRYARLKAKDLYGAWIRHLCLCALSPGGIRKRTVLVGRDRTVIFGEVADPLEPLRVLTGLYTRGRRGPCSFLPETSWTFCEMLNRGATEAKALAGAAKRWAGDVYGRDPGEASDPYNSLMYRSSTLPFAAGDGSFPDGEFRAVSLAVCDPVLQAMEEET